MTETAADSLVHDAALTAVVNAGQMRRPPARWQSLVSAARNSAGFRTSAEWVRDTSNRGYCSRFSVIPFTCNSGYLKLLWSGITFAWQSAQVAICGCGSGGGNPWQLPQAF